MATIERRIGKNGQTCFRAKIRRQGRAEISRTFVTRAAAKAWAARVETELIDGYYGVGAGRTLSEAIAIYVAERLHELRDYKTSATHIAWWNQKVGHHRLRDLSPEVIAAALQELVQDTLNNGRHRSGATINRYKATLSGVLSFVQRRGWITHNPARLVRSRKEASGRTKSLDDNERTRLLDACKWASNPALYPVVVLLLSTGSRLMEVMTLRWGDVDLERAAITIRRTKNGDARRVPLVHEAVSVLQNWLGRNDITLMRHSLVFPSHRDRGKPVDLRRGWVRALKKAGITDFRRHDLRHTAASALAASGASLLTIGAVLGHRSPAATHRYAHLTEDNLREAVEKSAQHHRSA